MHRISSKTVDYFYRIQSAKALSSRGMTCIDRLTNVTTRDFLNSSWFNVSNISLLLFFSLFPYIYATLTSGRFYDSLLFFLGLYLISPAMTKFIHPFFYANSSVLPPSPKTLPPPPYVFIFPH